jgi:hypothetical protein
VDKLESLNVQSHSRLQKDLRESFDHACNCFFWCDITGSKAAECFDCRNYRNHSLLDTLGNCLSD